MALVQVQIIDIFLRGVGHCHMRVVRSLLHRGIIVVFSACSLKLMTFYDSFVVLILV